ncbi:hypothetical protein [Demequina activiva]|uniref:Uncharacterized protein n=1 Tax=Demequina activiva TaxID=1582364 RepID=A0A919Q1G0_9MICO|nr:hypothetical protein [Demequina activiva]GIG54427.1 hypothetical protein Dac01nite_11790 [Demequina activiva]
MTTDDMGSRGVARRRWSTAARIGALAAVSTLALTACSSGNDGYVDAWFRNGDPIYAPLKADLFDEAGTPQCEQPLAWQRIETRGRSLASTGGIVVAWLFEVMNDEVDPETAGDDGSERAKLERAQGSLDRMYQWTEPTFDAENGITGPEDLEALKAQWQEHLAGMGEEAPFDQYARPGESWLVTPEVTYTIRRITDVEGFIEDNAIPTSFNGQRFDYAGAMNRETGVEYLMETSRETGETVLLSADEEIPVEEGSELYNEFEIDLDVGFPNEPEARLVLANDQCPAIDGTQGSRYWVFDFEMLETTSEEPVDLL